MLEKRKNIQLSAGENASLKLGIYSQSILWILIMATLESAELQLQQTTPDTTAPGSTWKPAQVRDDLSSLVKVNSTRLKLFENY